MLYNYLFHEIADDRVRDWLFMADPVPMFLIILLYLTIVFKIGPWFMVVRRPFNLKPLLAVYNLGMVVACLAILIGYYRSGVRMNSLMACLDIDYTTDDPDAMRILNVMWWTHIVKLVELVETVFFVLRKKQSQISFLHVYHHTVMVMWSFYYLKYAFGEQGVLIGFMNSFVHIIMYSYYLLAGLGPHMKKYLWWKKYLTGLQLVQFVTMITVLTVTSIIDCRVPKQVTFILFFLTASFLYLFLRFYLKSYSKGKEQVQPVKAGMDKNNNHVNLATLKKLK